jgi:hypothetical protein
VAVKFGVRECIFSYPGWFTDKLDVRIQTPNNATLINPNRKSVTTIKGQQTHSLPEDSNITIAVIVYRSLSNFLPERYVSRLR